MEKIKDIKGALKEEEKRLPFCSASFHKVFASIIDGICSDLSQIESSLGELKIEVERKDDKLSKWENT